MESFDELIANKAKELLTAEENLQLIISNAIIEQEIADPSIYYVEKIEIYPR